MKKIEKNEMNQISGGEVHHWDGGFTVCGHFTRVVRFGATNKFKYRTTQCIVFNNNGDELARKDFGMW